jgi:hypothetical protein
MEQQWFAPYTKNSNWTKYSPNISCQIKRGRRRRGVGQLTKLNLQAEQLEKIRHLVKVGKDHIYQFLGYTFDLETGEFHDLLEKDTAHSEWGVQNMTALLAHYSLANETPKSGKLVKFKDLPGGYAYEHAFTQRAVNPIAQAFGNCPAKLVEAAKLLKGKRLDYGDLSVEIPALAGIPIVYILWAAHEFSASATVLFDESASRFLDTEALAGLGELTTHRLLKAQSILREKTQ